MRVLCHTQGLIGIGPFVRTLAIARGLGAAGHEVHLVDGGLPVPRRAGPYDPRMVTLPRLVRPGGVLAALDQTGGVSVAEILAERTKRLADTVARIRPEVLLVEHYPFSKWELAAEIEGTITAARRANADVRVVCSVRDNLWLNYRRADPATYEREVLARLERFFDAILVHTDPVFARLEETFTRTAEIAVPLRYTGVVVDRSAVSPEVTLPEEPYAVLSCGGSPGNLDFLVAAIEAFRRFHARRRETAIPLFVFPGPASEADTAALRAAIGDDRVHLLGFVPDFPAWLGGSTLSISRAGYNTCAQVLAAGTPSVLVPNPNIADQTSRARRLAALGLATLVEGIASDPDTIAHAITAAVGGSATPRRALDLDGVAASCSALELTCVATGAR